MNNGTTSKTHSSKLWNICILEVSWHWREILYRKWVDVVFIIHHWWAMIYWANKLQVGALSSPSDSLTGRSENYGMVWVGSDLWISTSPTLLLWKGQLSQERVAHSPIHPGLKQFQGCGIHNFSRQFAPMSHHPHGKEFLPYIQSKSSLLQFKTIISCPVLTGLGKIRIEWLQQGPQHLLVSRLSNPNSHHFYRREAPDLLLFFFWDLNRNIPWNFFSGIFFSHVFQILFLF